MDDRGRVFEPVLVALAEDDGAGVILRSPAVGLWRSAPPPGTLVRGGDELGEVEVLGVLHQLRAPRDVFGVVERVGPDTSIARAPVGYGDELVRLTAEGLGDRPAKSAEAGPATSVSGGLYFYAPTSGRFYSRPDPDMAPFVKVGEEIQVGHTLCLLEVMKTFNRVTYGGEGFPERARVVAILPEDGSDLAAGDPIIELVAAGAQQVSQ